jgi:hypothetical protein
MKGKRSTRLLQARQFSTQSIELKGTNLGPLELLCGHSAPITSITRFRPPRKTRTTRNQILTSPFRVFRVFRGEHSDAWVAVPDPKPFYHGSHASLRRAFGGQGFHGCGLNRRQ